MTTYGEMLSNVSRKTAVYGLVGRDVGSMDVETYTSSPPCAPLLITFVY